jgi:hypothetical protein
MPYWQASIQARTLVQSSEHDFLMLWRLAETGRQENVELGFRKSLKTGFSLAIGHGSPTSMSRE